MFYLHEDIEMDGPKTKCPLPQIYTLESTGGNKINLVKENIPPKDLYHNSFDENLIPDGLQHCVKATPKKCKKELVEEPLTPNTNFKLLTSLAAARDYANCTTPKSRKPLKASFSKDNSEPNQRVAIRTARKEKSLAIICTRFLDLHPLYPTIEQKCIISLDEACLKLGIERRRLYDIVNVFESINMLNKLSKNKYVWFGKNKLMHSLHSIKASAKKENIFKKLQYVLTLEESRPDSKPSCILDEVADFSKQFENESASSMSSEMLQYTNFPELRKEKSLAFMSQRFLMLFLVSPTKIISLGVAAKVLNGFQKNDGGAQMKTQIRRLYDIANVLSSIGLIQKEVTIGQNGRKPAFKYIGPALDDEFNPRNPIPVTTPKKRNNKSKSLTRHSSFQEICAVAEIEHRKLCLDETPNSAPPFQNNLLSKNQTYVTNFSSLDFSKSPGTIKTTISEEHREEKKETHKELCQNGSTNKSADSGNDAQVFEKPISMPLQSNMTMINVPKGVFSENSSYYVLSPISYECLKETKQIGTFLLFTPESSRKHVMEDKISENEVVTSQSKELPELQNTNLKSSLGASQTEDAFLTAPSNLNLQHNLHQTSQLFTEKQDVNAVLNGQVSPIKPNKDTFANNMDSNESSSICSTRNNSPMSSTSRFDSPFSIPSGYVTPVPNVSSDVSFPSCVETASFLKIIEGCGDSIDLVSMPGNVSLNFASEGRSDMGQLTNYRMEQGKNSPVLKILVSSKQDVREQDRKGETSSRCKSNFILNNSCSSDSLNLEVSEILKGKRLGESSNKKHFSIDENTILSPFKKHKKEAFPKNLTPSPFITPLYVPEKVFVFNSASYQSTSMNNISHPRPLRIKNIATKNNLFRS